MNNRESLFETFKSKTEKLPHPWLLQLVRRLASEPDADDDCFNFALDLALSRMEEAEKVKFLGELDSLVSAA